MKIKLLSSSVDREHGQFAASCIINDTVAIDAGSLGYGSLTEQQRIRQIVLSHSHLDHVGSLPIFLDNIYLPGPECPEIYASRDVIDSLHRDFFNDRVWPDLMRLSREETPFVRFVELPPNVPKVIGNLRVTPVELDHVVPCFGFLIEEGGTAIVVASDTGPTEEIWRVARRCPELKAVFLECAFPDSLSALAAKSKHLAPRLFQAEYFKLGREVPIIAIHIKPRYYEQVVAGLRALGITRLDIGVPGRVYQF